MARSYIYFKTSLGEKNLKCGRYTWGLVGIKDSISFDFNFGLLGYYFEEIKSSTQ